MIQYFMKNTGNKREKLINFWVNPNGKFKINNEDGFPRPNNFTYILKGKFIEEILKESI